eukprot:1149430-Pelagomonas_calceolata.AAC.4
MADMQLGCARPSPLTSSYRCWHAAGLRTAIPSYFQLSMLACSWAAHGHPLSALAINPDMQLGCVWAIPLNQSCMMQSSTYRPPPPKWAPCSNFKQMQLTIKGTTRLAGFAHVAAF